MLLNRQLRLGRLTISLATLIAAIIIVADAALRLMLIVNNYPTTNSDEATVGLMALHINQGHDFPAFLYGQASLGALEAYVGAALFFILGPSVFALRLGVLLFFIAFLICMYLLTRLLYSKGLALVTLVLLSIGTPEILYRSIPAFAGHAETPLFGALIILISAQLGLASQVYDPEAGLRPSRRLAVLYLLWGIVAGVAFWNDALAGAFIVMGAFFILVCCRRTLKPSTLTALFAGLVIGILPVILNDLLVQGGHKSLEVLGFILGGASLANHSIFEHLAAAFLVSLPVATGGTAICAITNWSTDSWPVTSQSRASVIQCTALHGIWATVMLAAWIAAVVIEVSILSRRWLLARAKQRAKPDTSDGSSTDSAPLQSPSLLEQRAVVLRYARLMLLGSAALTWLVFAMSQIAIDYPWGDHRYLIGLGVATPAVIWPLWLAITDRNSKPTLLSRAQLTKVLSMVILLAFAGALVIGTADTFEQMVSSTKATQQQQELADTLVRLHLRHIYSEYWTCDLVSFLTKEQVICSVLDEHLNPGVNRYLPYASMVAQDPNAAYIFPISSPQAQAFAARAAQSKQPYNVLQFDNYILYQPVTKGL
ncbi:MAG TPA: hypothetical protein VGT44_10145 [Ktedonobacteraceae bacterium]|nr:hypothetical protein [Ktedonobacteraceae bacterium]